MMNMMTSVVFIAPSPSAPPRSSAVIHALGAHTCGRCAWLPAGGVPSGMGEIVWGRSVPMALTLVYTWEYV